MQNNVENEQILKQIISLVENSSFEGEISDTYDKAAYEKLLSGGVPYALYLEVTSTLNFGSGYETCYLKLCSEDTNIPADQKYYMIKLIESVKRKAVRKIPYSSKFVNIPGTCNKTSVTEGASKATVVYCNEFCAKIVRDSLLFPSERRTDYPTKNERVFT